MVLNQAAVEFETTVDFLPMDPERQCDIQRDNEYVSRNVPPFADEARRVKMRDDEDAVWHPGVEAVADPGMDIIETPETDFK